jgi:hypothetical protein
VRSHLPTRSLMSHSLIVLSSEPDASSRPSGLNATELTLSRVAGEGAHWLPLAEPNLSRIPCGHKQDRYGRADADKPYGEHTNLPSLARGAEQKRHRWRRISPAQVPPAFVLGPLAGL